MEKIAFVGSRQYDLYVGQDFPGNMGYPLTNSLEQDLLYDHAHAYLYLKQYMDLDIPAATEEDIQALIKLPDVKALQVWPNCGNSIVIDGILVIKFSN